MIARVAVFAPIRARVRLRGARRGAVAVGARVWAPFGGRTLEGVVVAVDPPDAVADAKPLAQRRRRAAHRRRSDGAGGVDGRLLSGAARRGDAAHAAGGRRGARAAHVALTDEGTRAATGLSAALEPVALDGLDGEARALLGALARGAARASRRPRRCTRSSSAALVIVDEAVSTRGARATTILRVAQPLDGDARAAAFGRARKRGEIYDRIAAAGTERCRRCAQANPRAGEHARALVEAGLVAAETRELSTIRSPRATEHARAADA